MSDYIYELSDEMRDDINVYVGNRHKQLYGIMSDAGHNVMRYLFITNAGGAVAVLTFMGTGQASESKFFASIALSFFFTGVILVGVIKGWLLFQYEGTLENYKKLIGKYYKAEITSTDMHQQDIEYVQNKWLVLPPYIMGFFSFGLFIAGCIIGTIPFWNC